MAATRRNPKAEIRRPKGAENSNPQIELRYRRKSYRISAFGFPSGFGFRPSDLFRQLSFVIPDWLSHPGLLRMDARRRRQVARSGARISNAPDARLLAPTWRQGPV